VPEYDATKTNKQTDTYRLATIFNEIILAALAGFQATSAEELERATRRIEAELAKLIGIVGGAK